MSEMRQTQLMEQNLPTQTQHLEGIKDELGQGYTAAQITAAGAETIVVKATPGKVARIRVVDGGITVTPKDGANAAWGALTNAAELDLGGTPMQFDTNISLEFDGPGRAFILYK